MSMKEKKVNGYDILSETIDLENAAAAETSAFQMKPFRANDTEYVSIHALLASGASGNVVATLHVSDAEDGTFTNTGATLFTIASSGTVGYAKVDLRLYPAPWYQIVLTAAADESANSAAVSVFRI